MKLKTIVLTLIAFSTISLSAENENFCDPCEPRCDQCDPCCDWLFHIDWLCWKVRRSDLDYVVPVVSETDDRLYGRVKCVSPDGDSGIRIGAFRNCDGNWRVGAQYTYFKASGKNSHSSDMNNLIATRPHPGIQPNDIVDDGAKYVSADYDVELNVLDIEAGYQYDLCCVDGFARPLVGAKFAFIDQKLVSDYERHSVPIKFHTIDQLDMDSYGAYFGLEGEWNLWCGFGFFGRAASGLNLAEFDIRHTDINTSTKPYETQVDVKKTAYLVVPHYELTTGVQLELCEYLCADWMVQLGYEYHHWCGVADFLNFVDRDEYGSTARSGSNLGFDGLFIRLNARY